MKQYLELMEYTLREGTLRANRTGTDARSTFGWQMHFDLSAGFPLLTTKSLSLRSILHELLWFLRGETNIRSLQEKGVHIWDEWADEKGDLGPVYGEQWRRWKTADGQVIDQIALLVENLKSDPDSRRHLVIAWNPGDIRHMALPPCHIFFQLYVQPANPRPRLSCQVYQCSADIFLGVPFNITSYALLTMMLAQVCNYQPGDLLYILGDAHLYCNHEDQARLQLKRIPRTLPRMRLNLEVTDLFDFTFEDFTLEGYAPYPHIAAPIAI